MQKDIIPLLLERDRSKAVGLLAELLSSEQVETRIAAAQALASSEKSDTTTVLSEHLPALLQDTTRTNSLISELTGQHTCVADVAYEFLKRRLTPTGEIRGLAEEGTEEG